MEIPLRRRHTGGKKSPLGLAEARRGKDSQVPIHIDQQAGWGATGCCSIVGCMWHAFGHHASRASDMGASSEQQSHCTWHVRDKRPDISLYFP